MKEEVKVRTQYSDYWGELLCDGPGKGCLVDVGEQAVIADDYFPVALSLYGEFPIRKPSMTILACSKERYGESMEEIVRKAVAEGQLEVKKFDLKMDVGQLINYVKRLSVLIKADGLKEVRLVTVDTL